MKSHRSRKERDAPADTMAVAGQAKALRKETEHRTLCKRRDVASDQLTRINRVIPRPESPSNAMPLMQFAEMVGVLASGDGV
jgi:hypothetical protein